METAAAKIDRLKRELAEAELEQAGEELDTHAGAFLEA
jgi:hypothetical protein